MLINKESKDYRIHRFNVNSIIILSTFAILLLYLSNTFLFDNIKQAWADTVLYTIPNVSEPHGIAYDPVNHAMYVAENTGTVSVIDTNTHNQIKNISITGGGELTGIAYDPVNKKMYVSVANDFYVSVIDTTTYQIVANINVQYFPYGIAYDPVNQKMYVANEDLSSVSVIDTKTYSVVTTINTEVGPEGSAPYDIAYDPVNQEMYVTNFDYNNVSVINTNNYQIVGSQISVGSEPKGIAYDPIHKWMYVTNSGANTVSVIYTSPNPVSNQLVATIPVGNGPQGIAYDPVNEYMYVANGGSNTVSVINTNNNQIVGSQIPVGSQPLDVAYDPDNKDVYVTNSGSSTVSVIGISIPPTHTAITSAVDGNGNPVQNDSSTSSTSITFTVQATAGANDITGFQCSLDNSTFSSCGTANNNADSITLNNLAIGQEHTIKIRAVDSQGNVDLTPATFSWTIITPGSSGVTHFTGGNCAESSSNTVGETGGGPINQGNGLSATSGNDSGINVSKHTHQNTNCESTG